MDENAYLRRVDITKTYWHDLSGCFRKPTDFLYLALGVFQPWSYFRCRIVNDAELGSLLPSAESYILVELAEALFALLIAVVFILKKTPRDKGLPFLPWPIMLLIGAFPFVISYLPHATRAVMISAMLFSACVHVWCYVTYVFTTYKLGAKRIVVYLLLSYAAATIIEYPLEMLPTVVTGIVTIPCPMLATLMCKRAQATENTTEKVALRKPVKEVLTSYILVIMVFGFTVGSCFVEADGTQAGSFDILITYAIEVALPLLLLVLLLKTYKRVSVVYLCQVTFVVILGVIMLLTLSSAEVHAAASTASHLARLFVRMFFMVGIVVSLEQCDSYPVPTFCVIFALLYLFMAAGIGINQYLSTSDVSPLTLYLLLIYAVVLVMFVIMSMEIKKGSDTLLFGETEESVLPSRRTNESIPEEARIISAVEVPYSALEKHFSEMAITYDLTPREKEVLLQIALGRSKSYIAEHLVLSENTVRGYARDAYKKLDIHSKQELLDTIQRKNLTE